MAAEIRQVTPEDTDQWFATMWTTFLAGKTKLTEPQRSWVARHWGDPSRRFGAFDDGRCVATLRTFPTTLTVPHEEHGTAEIATDALTQVTVAATHRRQGLLTTMLNRSLDDAKERGEIASVLLAAEWRIYGRFGYWPATSTARFEVDTRRSPRLIADTDGWVVRQVDPVELVKPGRDVLDRVRRQQAGHIARGDWFWERSLGLEGLESDYGDAPTCVVAARGDGEIEAFAVWASKDEDWFSLDDAAISVRQLLAASSEGYAAIWRYLLGMDLVRRINYGPRPVDEPLEFLLDDGRAARRTWTHDDLWVRLLDVPAALSARRYGVEDKLVLDVIDDDGGWAAGRVMLDGGPTHASCVPTPTATADLALSQRALAGLYLSGRTVWSQRLSGLVDESTPGACDRLQAMLFRDREPWNATPF